MTDHPRRFILLDRDGTLNVERHYLSDPDQLELLPGVIPALKRLRALGFGLAVVTNQSGVGRGYFTLEKLGDIHQRLRELLAEGGVALDAIYICPHTPDQPCRCRKPLPGMIEQAVAEFGFDPTQAIVIGDKAADIDLGHAVGATSILVRTGCEQAGACRPDAIVDDLAAAVDLIEKELAR
jgi:D-glycero-D-manno-heptose 1,7-bisphosphate phosphatase